MAGDRGGGVLQLKGVKRNEAGPTRADFDGRSRELTMMRKRTGDGGDFW
jgi:hypothetical protein